MGKQNNQSVLSPKQKAKVTPKLIFRKHGKRRRSWWKEWQAMTRLLRIIEL